MALIACPECGHQVAQTAKACPSCGARVSAGGGKLPWVVLAGLGLLVLLFLSSLAGNTPEAKERSAQRRAIEVCWQEQERKSQTPGAQRFIAGACERMEEEFRRKHGTSS